MKRKPKCRHEKALWGYDLTRYTYGWCPDCGGLKAPLAKRWRLPKKASESK